MIKCSYKVSDAEHFTDLEALNNFIMYLSCALDENKRDNARTEYRNFCKVMDAAIARREALERKVKTYE